MTWNFYGRQAELGQLATMLGRGRWFFAKLTGRRRIGKTTLIQQALERAQEHRVFYVQIPDSGPAGVLSAVGDAMQIFGIDPDRFRLPANLKALAQTIGQLARAGYIVALDEFQYFNRKSIEEFTSYLQAEVDANSARASRVRGGLFVLGSIYTEMAALLEDRTAPLYHRITDHVDVGHLDVASILELLRDNADTGPERLLFLWNLFEGVPKFYRDCYEHGALGVDRREVLRLMFFQSSSPLRTEADNWFLHELRGKYDVILKYVARNPGCSYGDIENHFRSVSPETKEQVGGYLRVLIDRYQMLHRQQPIFEKPNARKSRYYIGDNFLRAWLGSLANAVAALNFRPADELIQQADEKLRIAEGHGLERLVAQLYEERSRKGIGDFPLTSRISGYWDRNDAELDLIALNENAKIVRFGTCKRSAQKLLPDLPTFDKHIQIFLENYPKLSGWTVQKVAVAPTIEPSLRGPIQKRGYIPQDLFDLTAGL